MDIVKKLTETLIDRKNSDEKTSYTAKLYAKGSDGILKKIGEEIAEYIMAVKDKDKNKIICEAADVLFHLYVSLINENIQPDEVYNELSRRFGVSGIVEKESRKKPE